MTAPAAPARPSMVHPLDPERLRGEMVELPRTTRSGKGKLVPLDDATARDVEPEEILVARAGDGWRPMRFVALRDSGCGENSMIPCVVLDTVCCWSGRALVFAPVDLFRVMTRGQIHGG